MDRQTGLEQFGEWITYVRELAGHDEAFWNQPIAENKWTVRELVSHMLLWDKYFNEGAIERIALGQPLTIQHLDFDAFNANAKVYGKETPVQELIDQAIQYRTKIIQHISSLTEAGYAEVYQDGDGNPFAVEHYLRDFYDHDLHHMGQLKALVGNKS